MKKALRIATTMILMVAGLTACARHEHLWTEATCTAAKTCSQCGAAEGEAIGHKWIEATCAAPKTCSVCGELEGDALAHTWEQATCTEAMTCNICGATSGEPLKHDVPVLMCTEDAECSRCKKIVNAPGHTWVDATCVEKRACSVCGLTEGEPLGHTNSSGICERCGAEVYAPITGQGDDVITGVNLGNGLYRAHFVNNGRSNFIVYTYDATEEKELLVNEIGEYDGYVYISGKSPLIFEVSSSGNWSCGIEKLGDTSETTFSGQGDYVTNMFSTSSGAWHFTNSGKSNFVVKLYTTNGRDLLVNEIGSYDGKVMVNIPTGSKAFFEINSSGSWTAEPAT